MRPLAQLFGGLKRWARRDAATAQPVAPLAFEAFAQTVIDHQPNLVMFIDAECVLRFANLAVQHWFGVPREQAVGRPLTALSARSTALTEAAVVRRALDGENFGLAQDVPDRFGHVGHFWVDRLPERRQGRVVGYYLIATDVTALHRTEQLLRASNDELVLARDRAEASMRAKSSFLANMSHEIRTPLNAVIGLAHLLRRDTAEPRAAERLDHILDASRHLLSTVNQVLDLSKIGAGKLTLAPADFRLDALLDGCRAGVAEAARRKGLALGIDTGTAPQALHGDAARLAQALVCLLDNAVKFTEQGWVRLGVHVQAESAAGLLLRFEVQDSGPGLAPEVLESIFDSFEQADGSSTRRVGGSGVGLALTRHLAQLMGGGSGVESRLGAGSRFWFSARLRAAEGTAADAFDAVPRSDDPAPRLAPAVHAAERAAEQALRERHGGARVLLAEDNRLSREVASGLLRLAGFELDFAADGQAAIDAVQRTRYDLILMDMQMPGMDGLQATRAIRRLPNGAGVAIVATTANAFGADRAACLAAGMNDHLGKPIEPLRFYEVIGRWLAATGIGPRGAAISHPAAIPAAIPAAPSAADARLQALSALTGLTVPRGLAFFAGNAGHYVQALGMFAALYASGLAALPPFAERPDAAAAETLQREVHALAGAAAAIGAEAIRQQALAIDNRLREGEGEGESAVAELPALRALDAALRELVDRLGSALPAAR